MHMFQREQAQNEGMYIKNLRLEKGKAMRFMFLVHLGF
jgi:hypothetical protein